jgi:polyhydroxybutyrate depolymerase
MVDGQERMARIHPGNGVGKAAVPIVLGLHGYGGFGMEVERVSELSDAADEHGWIAVYPEGTGHPESWGYDPNGGGHAADIAFLRQLIADIVEGGCGDPDQIVVTGISQGGWLADMAGCELSDVVVGVVSVAARDFGWPCSPARPVAFAAVSGVKDDVLPWEGGPVNAPPPITSVSSVDDWLAARADIRGCSGDPAEARQSPHVVTYTWAGCDAPVVLYRVEDGGHSWPNGGGFPPVDHELSVTDIITGMLAANS